MSKPNAISTVGFNHTRMTTSISSEALEEEKNRKSKQERYNTVNKKNHKLTDGLN